jgi:hypothetical protein
MKYIITEKQHNRLLTVISEMEMTEQSSYERGIWDRSTKMLNTLDKQYTPIIDFYKQYNHEINTVLALGLGIFGGPIGIGIASGLGFLDAKQYFDEGDDKTGGMVLMFSLIPFAGPVISKLFPGAAKLGSKGMALLAKKISQKVKITDPAEIKIVTDIAKYRQIIEQEMKKIGKELSAKAASQTVRQNVKKKIVRKAVANKTKKVLGKTAKFAGTKVAPYVGAAAAYDKGYDAVTGNKSTPNLEDLIKVDKQKIAPTNLQASKELDF